MGLLDGTSCTSSGTTTCLTRGDSIGLTVIVESGLLSLLAILYLFALILGKVRWRIENVSRARLRIFHQPMDILIFSLICADILQAIGMVVNLKWIVDGKSEVGAFCTSQGVIKSIGATGVAFSTFAIGIYTFLGVWMSKRISSMSGTLGVVIIIWLFDAILIMSGFAANPGEGKSSFIIPLPHWCFVRPLQWRLLTEYLWIWLTGVCSILIYVPLYLWMRGNLSFDEAAWWKFHFKLGTRDADAIFSRRRSLTMLAYPLVYIGCIVIMSFVRWIQFSQESTYGRSNMPSAASFVGNAIFGLSGFFNVILLISTRPEVGLFGNLMFRSPSTLPSIMEMEERDAADSEAEADSETPRMPPDDG